MIHAGVKGNPTCTERSTRHAYYSVRGTVFFFLIYFFIKKRKEKKKKKQLPSHFMFFCFFFLNVYFLWEYKERVKLLVFLVYPFSFPITFYVFPTFSLSNDWKRSMGKKWNKQTKMKTKQQQQQKMPTDKERHWTTLRKPWSWLIPEVSISSQLSWVLFCLHKLV